MKVGIMQPYFFPYIGYFQLINYVDTYVIYDDVNFIKNGYINRNKMLINGEASLITLSLSKQSSFQKINEIHISNSQKMRIKLRDSIYYSYKKAPMFTIVMPILEQIILSNEKNLAKYLIFSIIQICSYLKISTKIIVSSDLKKNNILKGQQKVIHICKLLNATSYVNSYGGKGLYDKDIFKSNDIDLLFLQPNEMMYKQYKNKFVNNLSIIDVLMFNNISETQKLLKQFTLS